MKYLKLLIIIIFIGCVNEDSIKVKPNYYKIEGIKKVEEYLIYYKYGVLDTTTKELKKITFYDKNGNPKYDTEYYTINGLLDSNVTNYSYDNFGNLIESKNLLSNGKINSLIRYEYNQKNELIKLLNFDEFENIYFKKEFLYINGENIQITETDSKNEIKSIKKFKYKDGFESETLVYNKLNQLISKKVLTKIENGIVYMDEYNEENKLIRKTESKYENGFEVSFRIIDETAISGLFFESFYNEKKLEIKTIHYMDNEPHFISEYIYFK